MERIPPAGGWTAEAVRVRHAGGPPIFPAACPAFEESGDGCHLLAWGGEAVALYDRATGSPRVALRASGVVLGAGIGAEDRAVYVLEERTEGPRVRGAALHRLDLSSGEHRELASWSERAGALAVSPREELALVLFEDGQLRALGGEGRERWTVPTSGTWGDRRWMLVSGDGQRLGVLVCAEAPRSFHEQDPDSFSLGELDLGGARPDRIRWVDLPRPSWSGAHWPSGLARGRDGGILPITPETQPGIQAGAEPWAPGRTGARWPRPVRLPDRDGSPPPGWRSHRTDAGWPRTGWSSSSGPAR